MCALEWEFQGDLNALFDMSYSSQIIFLLIIVNETSTPRAKPTIVVPKRSTALGIVIEIKRILVTTGSVFCSTTIKTSKDKIAETISLTCCISPPANRFNRG